MHSGFDSCLHKKLIREGNTSENQAQIQERVAQVALSLIPGQLIMRVFELICIVDCGYGIPIFPFSKIPRFVMKVNDLSVYRRHIV